MQTRSVVSAVTLTRRIAGIAAVSMVVLAGCTGGDVEDDGGEASEASGETPAADETPASEEGDEGSQIVAALDTDVSTIEPHTLRSTGAFAVTGALYDGLTREVLEENEQGILEGTAEFEPGLAESVEVSENGTQVTIELRDEATFANGDPITAQDVVWSFRRVIEPESYLLGQLSFIGITSSDQFEAVDEDTVVIEPSTGSPLLRPFLANQTYAPLNQSVAEEQATEDDPWAKEWYGSNATPSGPYQLAEYDPEREIVLEPNPHYYAPDTVRNDGVTIRSVPDAEQRALLVESGELDFATGIPPSLLSELQGTEGVTVYNAPSTRLHYLGMNNEIAPFDDVTFRQAISHAVPYETLINEVLEGFGSPAGGLVTSNMDTYAGDEIGTYDEDLDRAQELLEEAGGAPESPIELAVRQSRSEEQDAAIFIQENLRQIGVDVEVNTLPDGQFFERLNNKELALFIHDWYQWGEDPFVLMNFLVQSEEFTNYTQFDSEELDRILEEGTTELDAERRAELSRQAQEILLEQAPMAYLYSKDWSAVARDEVDGVVKDQTQVVRFQYLEK